jgi:hypothetical protein
VITLSTTVDFGSYELTVRGPGDIQFKRQFRADEAPYLDLYDADGALLPDGLYKFEVRANPVINEARKRQAMDRVGGERPMGDLVSATYSGTYRIHNGEIMNPVKSEPGFSAGKEFSRNNDDSNPVTDADTGRDIVHGDDVIITRSLCVGFDCVNGEVFGSDTIRLKENNLRIHFMDTSAGAFPTQDWRIVANSNASGGGEFLAFNDADTGRNVFLVEANAPSNALYVDDGGRVGLGTSTPSVEMHIIDGDTPAVRLAQDGSSGFQPQSWDLAGNETSFFIRDVSNGSTLPFRIRPSSSTNTLTIGSNGVGVNKLDPSVDLEVVGNALINGTGADLVIEDTTGSSGSRRLLTLTNEGTVNFRFSNTGVGGENWDFQNKSNGFFISDSGSGVDDFVLESGGDLTIAGNLTELSSRHAKENLELLDTQDVLERVMSLPINSWNYIHDDANERHAGVMAQDFYAAFEFGKDENHISTMDTAGVALASIQAVVKQKDAEIAELKQDLAAQAQRLERLEALLLNK